jgi:hypothetical protein
MQILEAQSADHARVDGGFGGCGGHVSFRNRVKEP